MKPNNILFLSIFALGFLSSQTQAAEIACPPTWQGYRLLSGVITDIDPNERKEENYLTCTYGIEGKEKETDLEKIIYQNYIDCTSSTVHPNAFTRKEKTNSEQNLVATDEPVWTYITHEGNLRDMQMTGERSPRATAFLLPYETEKRGLDTFVCMLRIPAEKIYGTVKKEFGGNWYDLKAIVGTEGIVKAHIDPETMPSIMVSSEKMTEIGAVYKTVGETTYYHIPEDGQENGSIVKIGDTYKFEYVQVSDQQKVDVKGFHLYLTFTNQIRKITAEDNQVKDNQND
ncbi:MAG: hypothetical protein R3A45_05940 [Bdellovibrionota bacterium]